MYAAKLMTATVIVSLVSGCGGPSDDSQSSGSRTYHSDLYVGSNSSNTDYPAVMGIDKDGYDIYTGEPFWITGRYYSEAGNIDFSVSVRWGLSADHSISGTISGDDMVVNIIDDKLPENNTTLTLFALPEEDRLSLSDLEGTWEYSDSEITDTLSISANGEFTGVSNQGCQYSGTFTEKNVVGYFSAEFSVIDCEGSFEYVNGNFNGQMIALSKDYTTNPKNSANVIYLLATETAEDAGYAFFVDKFVKK